MTLFITVFAGDKLASGTVVFGGAQTQGRETSLNCIIRAFRSKIFLLESI